MPDRWIAVLKSGTTTIQVFGRDIARPLYVGPDPNPQTPPPIVGDDQLQVDPGMKWMVDFDEAEQKGMALRITVPPAALSAGLDSLFVFGVAGSLTRRRHRQAVCQSARRASLHRRARIPPLRHADQQYRRAPRRRHPRRPGARAQLRHRGRRRPDGARRAVQCDARRHGAREFPRRRSCRCSAISGRLPSTTSSTCAA